MWFPACGSMALYVFVVGFSPCGRKIDNSKDGRDRSAEG
jgi:hypothetical protein